MSNEILCPPVRLFMFPWVRLDCTEQFPGAVGTRKGKITRTLLPPKFGGFCSFMMLFFFDVHEVISLSFS